MRVFGVLFIIALLVIVVVMAIQREFKGTLFGALLLLLVGSGLELAINSL